MIHDRELISNLESSKFKPANKGGLILCLITRSAIDCSLGVNSDCSSMVLKLGLQR